MTYETVMLILDMGLKIVAFGYFIHGCFWKNTHSMATAAVLTLFATT